MNTISAINNCFVAAGGSNGGSILTLPYFPGKRTILKRITISSWAKDTTTQAALNINRSPDKAMVSIRMPFGEWPKGWGADWYEGVEINPSVSPCTVEFKDYEVLQNQGIEVWCDNNQVANSINFKVSIWIDYEIVDY